jgi:hypothetical protein
VGYLLGGVVKDQAGAPVADVLEVNLWRLEYEGDEIAAGPCEDTMAQAVPAYFIAPLRERSFQTNPPVSSQINGDLPIISMARTVNRPLAQCVRQPLMQSGSTGLHLSLHRHYRRLSGFKQYGVFCLLTPWILCCRVVAF